MVHSTITRLIDNFDCCPWGAMTGRPQARTAAPPALYTTEQRQRRDATRWTMVQGVLAPVQFMVFLVSLSLVLHFLFTGSGLSAATSSIVLKTVVLYAIMITGAFWERAVFGRYLFARAFFWEDVMSTLVMVLHTAYVAELWLGAVDSHQLMLLALAAYAAYLINAAQYVLKLRAARRDSRPMPRHAAAMGLG